MDGQPAAGWYNDGTGTTRWWDGSSWTDHIAPVAAPEAEPVAAASVASPSYPGSASGSHGAQFGGDPRFGTSPGGVTDVRAPATEQFGAVGDAPGQGRRAAEPASGIHRQLSPRVEGVALLLLGSIFVAPVLFALFSAVMGSSGATFNRLAIVFGVIGAIVAGNGIAALVTGNRAPALSWVSIGHRDAPRGDKRVLVLLGVMLVLLAGCFLLLRKAPSSAQDAARPAASAPAVAKAKLPKGYTAVGPTGGYKLLAASATSCAQGTSCRAVSLASRTSCKTLTALVTFATSSGNSVGSDVVVVKRTKPGTPVKTRAAITEPGGKSVRVTSLVCEPL